jgi:hypothetical protein
LHFLATEEVMMKSLEILLGSLVVFSVACSSQNAVSDSACGMPFHGGLTSEGIVVPHRGVFNKTLKNFNDQFNGPSSETAGYEQKGVTTTYQNCLFVKGGASHFGGPDDTGVRHDEVGAVTGENLRALNNPTNPTELQKCTRSSDYYYAAMRLDYSKGNIEKWRRARLLLINPSNGKTVVVRLVDWGPAPWLENRIIDVSPQALNDLGLATDSDVLISFATTETPLGVVK